MHYLTHYTVWNTCLKDPNITEFSYKVCLTGWVDTQAVQALASTFNFKTVGNTLKQLRKCISDTQGIDIRDLGINGDFYMASCIDYIILYGCDKSSLDPGFIMKKVVRVVEGHEELQDNDYRRIMILQKIVMSTYGFDWFYRRTWRKQTIFSQDYIHDLATFLPFIEYELSQDFSSWNLVKLLGLMTNIYRGPNWAYSNPIPNVEVIRHICNQLQPYVANLTHISISTLSDQCRKAVPSLLEDIISAKQNFAFQETSVERHRLEWISQLDSVPGRQQIWIINTLRNTVLRDLMMLVVFHITYTSNPSSESVINVELMQDLVDQYDEKDIYTRDLLLSLFKSVYIERGRAEECKEALAKSLLLINSFEKYDSVDKVSFALEIFKCVHSMLQQQSDIVIGMLKDIDFGSYLERILKALWSRRNFPKPHAYDFLKHTILDDLKMREDNDKMVEDTYGDVDTVLESFQRELVTYIFKTMNLLVAFDLKMPELRIIHDKEQINNQYENKRNTISSSDVYNLLPIVDAGLIEIIKEIFIKWVNFEHECHVSSEINEFLISIDSNQDKLSSKDDDEERCDLNNRIRDLCARSLSFFTYLKREDIHTVDSIVDAISEINFEEPKDGIINLTGGEKSSKNLEIIFLLISFLIRVNSLLDLKEDTDKECIHAVFRTISKIYVWLLKSIKDPSISREIWSFNSYFFSLSWQNCECNDQHFDFLNTIMTNINSQKLSLDSVSCFKGYIAKFFHICPDEYKNKVIISEEDEFPKLQYKLANNVVKSNEQVLRFIIDCFKDYHLKFVESNRKLSTDDCIQSRNMNLVDSEPDIISELREYSLSIGKSKVVGTLIQTYLKDLNRTDEDEREKSIRKLQLFIYRLFHSVDKIELSPSKQDYALHALTMIHQIVDWPTLMSDEEMKDQLYSGYATNVLFMLIIESYNYTEWVSKLRQYAYSLLLKLAKIDITKTRNSFRNWTNQGDNKAKFFKRIIDLINEFKSFFSDEICTEMVGYELDMTDYRELMMSLKWLTLLIANNKKWQEYMSEQDNWISSQNLLLPIVELIRLSILRLSHEYVIDLLQVVVWFITESINGKHKKHINEYVSARIFIHAQEILKLGYYDLYENYYDMEAKIVERSTDHEDNKLDEDGSEQRTPVRKLENTDRLNIKSQLLKQTVLIMINWMLLPETEHQFFNEENHSIINDILKFSYAQLRAVKYDNYTTDLFVEKSQVSMRYNILVGFQAYYLISQLWKNNGIENFNAVQMLDTESIYNHYSKLLKSLLFKLRLCKSRSALINEHQYEQTMRNRSLTTEATKFFDSHSSCIEIVMVDGTTTTRHFEILPAFLSFTQTEKNEFWISANLDNSKSAVKSFMEFSNDKIDEIFIQQHVQDWKISLRDAAKKQSWITDMACFLILVMNFILFFGLEAKDGDKLSHPSIFGASSGVTNAILYTLGCILFALFVYIATLQGAIMMFLNFKRAKNDKNWNGGAFHKTIEVLKYAANNLSKILQKRNMWCLLAWIWFSLTGLIHEFYWFSFTLIYILIFSAHIAEVTSAVWQPRRRILSTVVLSFIVLYWFAVIAYVSFDEDFEGVVSGSGETMRRSLMVIFDSWYKFTLGGFLADNGKPAIMDDSNNYDVKGGRVTYDFMFFFIVPTLLLSILSGIIIDNFVERRSHSDSISQRQNDLCFIWGTEANALQDFEKHCKFHHNIWDYMYYIGFLRSLKPKDLKDYRDIYVSQCLTSNNNDWFPAYRDFVVARLSNSQPKNDTPSVSVDSSNQTLFNFQTVIDSKLDNFKSALSSTQAQNTSELNSKVSSLESKIDTLSTQVAQILSTVHPSPYSST